MNLTILRGILARSRELESLALWLKESKMYHSSILEFAQNHYILFVIVILYLFIICIVCIQWNTLQRLSGRSGVQKCADGQIEAQWTNQSLVHWQGLGHPNRHRLHRNEVPHEQAAFLPLLRKSDLHSRKNWVKRTVGIAFMMKEKLKIAL